MVPEFVDRTGGSKWQSALPTGSRRVQAQPARRQQVAVGTADRQQVRAGNADRSFPENSGKPEKLGTLIYGPQFRVLSGGSKWLSALPTGGSKWVQALPARRQQVAVGSADR